jgi:hypothetical protein
MNSPRKSRGAVAVRVLSRMSDRPQSGRSRRFRPLAEPLEARAVLSPLALTRAILDPIALGGGPPALVNGLRPAAAAPAAETATAFNQAALSDLVSHDTVEVNGQVELQPGGLALSGLSPLGSTG